MPLGFVVTAVLDDEVWLRLGLHTLVFSLYILVESHWVILLTMFGFASKVFSKRSTYYNLLMGSLPMTRSAHP